MTAPFRKKKIVLGFLLAHFALFNVKFPPFNTKCYSYNLFSLVPNCICCWTFMYAYVLTLHSEYPLLLHKLLLYFCHNSFFFLLLWVRRLWKPTPRSASRVSGWTLRILSIMGGVVPNGSKSLFKSRSHKNYLYSHIYSIFIEALWHKNNLKSWI